MKRSRRVSLARIAVALMLLAGSMIGLVAAANDPGHDTLYIEEQGSSELNGTLNITQNISIIGGKSTVQGLILYGDGTLPSPGSPYMSAVTNDLYLDAQGNLYLKWMSGGDTVFVGATGTPTDLNVSGSLYVQGSTATVNGQGICLADGSNCPSGLSGANVSSVNNSLGAPSNLVISPTTGDVKINLTIPTCTGAQKLTYDGSNISCADDETGGSGDGNVSSTGSTDYIPVFSSNSIITNSIMSQSGNSLMMNNIAIGDTIAAIATGTDSIAIGNRANATGNYAVGVGYFADAINTDVVAIGKSSKATVAYAIAVGTGSSAAGNSAVALGAGAMSQGTGSIALGGSANATPGAYSTAIGYQAKSGSTPSIAIGFRVNASSTYTVSIGSDVAVAGSNSIGMGDGVSVAGANSVGIGDGVTTTAVGSIAMGADARSVAGSGYSLAIGYSADAEGDNSVAIGRNANASSTTAIALGFTSQAASSSVAIGNVAIASVASNIALGNSAYAGGGSGNSISIGRQTNSTGTHNIAIGQYAGAYGTNYAIGIGYSANASHSDAVAIGRNAQTTATNQVMIGSETATLNVMIHGSMNASGLIYEANGSRVCTADNGECVAGGTNSHLHSTLNLTDLGNLTNTHLHAAANITGQLSDGQISSAGTWNTKGDVNFTSGASTAGYLAQWQATGALNNSAIYQNGTNIGIGVTSPGALLQVGVGSDSKTCALCDVFVTRAGDSGIAVRDATNDVETLLYAASWGGMVGTVTEDNLSIRTNDTTRIFLDTVGRVGIGTSSISYPFHFSFGTASVENATFGVSVVGGNVGDMAGITFQGGSNEIGGIYSTVKASYLSDMVFYTANATNNLVERMRLDSSGNVGLGTASPETTLQIATGADASPSTHGYLELGISSGANIVIDSNEIMARNNGANSTLYFQHDGGDFMVHGAVAGTELVVKDATGYTGVGTLSPGARLESLWTGGAQLKLSYTSTVHTNFTTSSGGDLTIRPTGGDVIIQLG